jgi:hypothetical protein
VSVSSLPVQTPDLVSENDPTDRKSRRYQNLERVAFHLRSQRAEQC